MEKRSGMDVSKHIDRAEKETARKNYDLAISLYDQILAIQPDEGRARIESIKPGTHGQLTLGWGDAQPCSLGRSS